MEIKPLSERSNEELITETMAAEYLCMSVHTLRRWRQEGSKLKYKKLGRSVRYQIEEIRNFLSSAEMRHTEAA